MQVSINPLQGRPLPPDWKEQAERNRRHFDAELRAKLESQWKAPLSSSNGSAAMAARLGRQDSRLDALRLVADDGEQEVWQAPGIRVVRRK